MEHNTSLECLHEEQIQKQSRKIERLEVRADFKEEQINQLNSKMDKLNDKLDKVLDGFNDLNIKSTKDDKELELRLKSMETEIKLLKQENKLSKKTIAENRARSNQYLSIISIIFIVLTFYFQFIHN